jgi:hypothetical protein
MRRPAGGGARRISDHAGHKRSLNVRLRRATGDALNSLYDVAITLIFAMEGLEEHGKTIRGISTKIVEEAKNSNHA